MWSKYSQGSHYEKSLSLGPGGIVKNFVLSAIWFYLTLIANKLHSFFRGYMLCYGRLSSLCFGTQFAMVWKHIRPPFPFVVLKLAAIPFFSLLVHISAGRSQDYSLLGSIDNYFLLVLHLYEVQLI